MSNVMRKRENVRECKGKKAGMMKNEGRRDGK